MDNKTKKPVPLSEILHTFFNKQYKQSDQWFSIQLWQKWPELTTSDILKQTKPVSFQRGRMVLWVENSVELQELSFYIEELKDNINSYFNKQWVKEIHFTLNKDILKKREYSAKLFQKIFN